MRFEQCTRFNVISNSNISQAYVFSSSMVSRLAVFIVTSHVCVCVNQQTNKSQINPLKHVHGMNGHTSMHNTYSVLIDTNWRRRRKISLVIRCKEWDIENIRGEMKWKEYTNQINNEYRNEVNWPNWCEKDAILENTLNVGGNQYFQMKLKSSCDGDDVDDYTIFNGNNFISQRFCMHSQTKQQVPN